MNCSTLRSHAAPEGGARPAAPADKLSEPSRHGPLPKIAQDGTRPAEAFARAVAAGPSWHEVANPEAWLRVVALNVLRTRARRSGLLRRATPLLAAPVASEEPDVDHVPLVTAMRQLPRVQREVLALHYFADLPVAEVAAGLGVPVGTVKSRLSRGREALARLLPSDDSEVEGGRRV